MIERIFKNWKTSVFGFILLGFSGYLIVEAKASITDVSAFLATSIVLFYSKDPK